MRARLLLLLLAVAGLGLRLWWLPSWGTFDTEVQKAWAWRAATAGVADVYGPSDAELLSQARAQGRWVLPEPAPRTVFEWGTARYFVDYPPGSVLVLWAAGTGYRLADPGMPDRWPFNVAINVAPLLGSLAIALLLLRSAPRPLGAWRALAFWLNPAVILAAPVLGYQDTVFGAFALGAVLALGAGRHAAATALVVAAGLVKPQGALLLPALLAVVLREGRPAGWLRAALAGAGTAAAILCPWWSRGHLLSALEGALRPLSQGTLAAYGFNLWWIAGYVMEWARKGPWPLARNAAIQEFDAWSGIDARLAGRVAVLAATAAILAFLLRRPRGDRSGLALALVLQVHAYALVATSVHENHTFLAVVLAPLLLGEWPRARALNLLTSAFLFANLFLTAGFGRRVTKLTEIETLRLAPGLDLSVLVAALHVVLVAVLAAWALRVDRTSSDAMIGGS